MSYIVTLMSFQTIFSIYQPCENRKYIVLFRSIDRPTAGGIGATSWPYITLICLLEKPPWKISSAGIDISLNSLSSRIINEIIIKHDKLPWWNARRTLNYTLTTATKTTKVIKKTFKYMVLETLKNKLELIKGDYALKL